MYVCNVKKKLFPPVRTSARKHFGKEKHTSFPLSTENTFGCSGRLSGFIVITGVLDPLVVYEGDSLLVCSAAADMLIRLS
jgi:hypothetical protein